jgi:type IV pilus assembly protein PilC
MATSAASAGQKVKEFVFEWEGKDKAGKIVRGEVRAAGEAAVNASLRRQGILVSKVKKRRAAAARAIKQKDIAIFTRQLATMMKAGVPLLQAFDIVARGSANPTLTRLLLDIRSEVETGTNLSVAFRKHPKHFNELYCNLVEAGESGGILEELLDRLAQYQEKTMALQNKIKSALMYPAAVVGAAIVVVAVIMIFVIPAFKDVFSSFGAELPAPTLAVIWLSEVFVSWWWLMLGAAIGAFLFLKQLHFRSAAFRALLDRLVLKLPVFGELINKAIVARWTRTLSTMFGAGVPLVEALESVGGAAGNALYTEATRKIRLEIATGSSLMSSMSASKMFPSMVIQMTAIGEESGSLDHMLAKAAEFFENEVDEMVKGLSSLMEPFIIIFLGGLIGGIVVAMYMPLFKLGSVV